MESDAFGDLCSCINRTLTSCGYVARSNHFDPSAGGRFTVVANKGMRFVRVHASLQTGQVEIQRRRFLVYRPTSSLAFDDLADVELFANELRARIENC